MAWTHNSSLGHDELSDYRFRSHPTIIPTIFFILISLHWHPFVARIKYKTDLLCFTRSNISLRCHPECICVVSAQSTPQIMFNTILKCHMACTKPSSLLCLIVLKLSNTCSALSLNVNGWEMNWMFILDMCIKWQQHNIQCLLLSMVLIWTIQYNKIKTENDSGLDGITSVALMRRQVACQDHFIVNERPKLAKTKCTFVS